MKNKTLLILGSLLFFMNLSAQVGINTSTPNSTFVVEGSYEGAFKEITANTSLSAQDQYVTVTGAAAVTVTLPDGTVADSFSGRVYQIRNNSTQNVTVTGFGGTQLIRVTGTNNVTSYSIPAGGYVQVVKNDQSSAVAPLWELSFLGASLPTNVKTLTYVRKTVSPIDTNTPANSVITIGNISLRYNGTVSNSGSSIEYNLAASNHVTILYHKAGSGGVNLEQWGRQASVAGTWYSFNGEQGNATRDINPANRDIGYAIIVLHNTKEVYRVTANVNGDIAVSGAVPATVSSVTLFLEKLD